MRIFINSCFLLLFTIISPSLAPAATLAEQASVRVRADAYSANGVLILWQGQPAVLTNHHLVHGSTALRVLLDSSLTDGRQKLLPAELIQTFPAGDLAVLALPTLTNPPAELLAAARNTLSFACTGEPCRWYGSHTTRVSETDILADPVVVSRTALGNVDSLPAIGPVAVAQRIADNYVSGIYGHVLRIHTYGAPGVSGSGVYSENRFRGMATVIHRDMGSEVYAIPLSELTREILRVLNAPTGTDLVGNPIRMSDGERKCRAMWREAIAGSRGMVHGLRLPARGEGRGTGTDDDGGGGGSRTRSGGGDLGSGGDGSASPLWELEFPLYIDHSEAGRMVPTINPFALTNPRLELDGRSVLALKDDGILKSPTLPRICRALMRGQRLRIVEDSARERERLYRARQEFRQDEPTLSWLRVWEDFAPEDGISSFNNRYPLAGGSFSAGVLDLSFMHYQDELSDPRAYYWNIPNLQIQLPQVPGSFREKQVHVHFSKNRQRYLSILIEEMQLGFWVSADFRELHLFRTPPLDFSHEAVAEARVRQKTRHMGLEEIMYVNGGFSNVSPVYLFVPTIEDEVTLSLVSEGSMVNHYRAAGADAEAIAVFDPEDLEQMNRIIVRYGSQVLEFNRCHPVVLSGGLCPED